MHDLPGSAPDDPADPRREPYASAKASTKRAERLNLDLGCQSLDRDRSAANRGCGSQTRSVPPGDEAVRKIADVDLQSARTEITVDIQDLLPALRPVAHRSKSRVDGHSAFTATAVDTERVLRGDTRPRASQHFPPWSTLRQRLWLCRLGSLAGVDGSVKLGRKVVAPREHRWAVFRHANAATA
jgi:hypothetical protein